MKKEFLAWFKTQSLSEMADVIGHARDIRSDKFRDTYRTVEVYNQHCNISHHIEKATGYQCYHQPADRSGCIGTNIILVPVAEWTPKLESELTAVWDNFRPNGKINASFV